MAIRLMHMFAVITLLYGVNVVRHYGLMCVAANDKWCELFERCYCQLLGSTPVSSQLLTPTPELSQRMWQNIAALLNNASTSSYR